MHVACFYYLQGNNDIYLNMAQGKILDFGKKDVMPGAGKFVESKMSVDELRSEIMKKKKHQEQLNVEIANLVNQIGYKVNNIPIGVIAILPDNSRAVLVAYSKLQDGNWYMVAMKRKTTAIATMKDQRQKPQITYEQLHFPVSNIEYYSATSQAAIKPPGQKQ